MSQVVPNSLGVFLRELRGKMTLREVAAKSGLSHTYIRDLELGVNRKTKAPINPTPETIKRLSEAYNYSYEDLMEKAGYLEDQEAIKTLDEVLLRILKVVKITKDHLKEAGIPENIKRVDFKEFLEIITLEEKVSLLFVATDNLTNSSFLQKISNGDSNLSFDLDDDNLVDKINLSYKGMDLTRTEKLEFMSIARAIFSARRGMK